MQLGGEGMGGGCASYKELYGHSKLINAQINKQFGATGSL